MFLGTAVLIAIFLAGVRCQEIGSFNPDYGVFLGELPSIGDAEIKGKVYVINETALQVLNFTYNGNAPDLYFWLDIKDTPTVDGLKIPTFEFGITPLGPYENAERVVLILPAHHKITSFKSFSLFCVKFEHNLASLSIPEGLSVPKPQFLSGELKGSRYNVASGPILVIDRRTIKVFGFTFDADKAPDGYFFVGRGPNVAHDAGVKIPIRGRDSTNSVTAMNERYRGGQDIVLDLPEDYDIEHIDWLSIYCYKFRVDFGHINVNNVSQRIPPFVPIQKRFDELTPTVIGWKIATLLGTEARKNFTFQLGAPGALKGYQFMTKTRPNKYVWYVNGLLADIYLKRGTTYTFFIEGGNDKSTSDFYNPLYLSDDQFGGYGKLSKEEKEDVHIFSGSDPSEYNGRLCVWSNDDEIEADNYNSFMDFRKTLRLKCETDKPAAEFQFTPDENTPNVLYYQSYSSFNMGWKIHIVDELPENIQDFKEEPYSYEQWLQTQANRNELSSAGFLSTLLVIAITLLLL